MAILLAGGSARLGAQPQIAGCPVFPWNNIWNTRIDQMPVDRGSNDYIATNGDKKSLHPDFGPSNGIPFDIVPESQSTVRLKFTYSAESDPGPYPIPDNPNIENNGDAHVLVIQQGSCRLFELYAVSLAEGTVRAAGSGAIFEMRANKLRPSGWTSADAAGLPVFAGLVRYDEVASGEIRHALRLSAPLVRMGYVWPARHAASKLTGAENPPLGMRFRLKADYDISGFLPENQVILTALKRYGAILADTGSAWFISGAPDQRWDNDRLSELKRVLGSDLEAVDTSSLMLNSDSAQVLPPVIPVSSTMGYSPSPTFDLAAGATQRLVLTGDVTNSTTSNLSEGQTVTFLICQDEAGGHAFQWPENTLGGMRIGQAPGKCSAQQFVVSGKFLYATSPGVADM